MLCVASCALVGFSSSFHYGVEKSAIDTAIIVFGFGLVVWLPACGVVLVTKWRSNDVLTTADGERFCR